MNSDIRLFSLLTPDADSRCFTLSDSTANDLSLDFLAEQLSRSREEQNKLRRMLMEMPADASVITYRQEIYQDLRQYPDVCAGLQEIFDAMQFCTMDEASRVYEKSSIWELITRMRSLQNYVSAVTALRTLLKDVSFSSTGMRTLRDYIESIHAQSGFEALAKDMEVLGDDVDGIRSMTLGVNLGSEFYPDEVGILSLNNFRFGERGMLEHFFRFHKKQNPDERDLTPFTMVVHPKNPSANEHPLMNNLTRIVEQMLPSVTKKLQRMLKKYTDISGTALAKRGDELMFYLRFLELEQRLTAGGFSCCMPDLSGSGTNLTDFYNVKLALCHLAGTVEDGIVTNDLCFTKERNILILTGPNRGGKTILTQGAGLALLLFQHGVCVPCRQAAIRPCDGIYTHFPADENETVTLGRLGEESARFSRICETATDASLLLFNESFATTSHSESLYIAEDVVRYLCCLGARTIFNTHMHELAEHADSLTCERAVCGAASVVMGKRGTKDAYRIRFEKPDGKSSAHEIARQYGITLEQLMENLNG